MLPILDKRNVYCENASNIVRILVGEWRPFLIVRDNGGELSVDGPASLLLDEFCERTQTGYELVKEGFDWVDWLYRKDADIELGPSVINYNRFQLVGFTTYLTVEKIAILSSSSTTSDGILSVFLSIDKRVWMLLFSSVAFFSVCTYFLEVIYYKAIKRTKDGIMDCYLFYFEFFTTLIGNSLQRTPGSHLARLVLGMSLILIFLMKCLFTSVVSTDLVLNQGSSVIKSLEDLVKRQKVCPFMFDKTPLQHMFKTSPEQAYRIIYDRAEKCEHTPTTSKAIKSREQLQRLANGLYAFIDDEGGMFELGNKLCEEFPGTLLHISKPFTSRVVAAVFRRDLNETLVRKLNEQASRLVESGLFLFNVKKWSPNLSNCFHEEANTGAAQIQAVAIHNLHDLFLVMFVGYGIAAVCLCLEMLIRQFTRLFHRFCPIKKRRLS